MKPDVDEIARWSTSSLGGAADTSPAELSTLTTQLHDCRASRGRLFALGCAIDTLARFMSARVVTTVVLVALLLTVAALMS